jgi:hypothetical protein
MASCITRTSRLTSGAALGTCATPNGELDPLAEPGSEPRRNVDDELGDRDGPLGFVGKVSLDVLDLGPGRQVSSQKSIDDRTLQSVETGIQDVSAETFARERPLQRPEAGRRAALRYHEGRPRAPRADDRNRGQAVVRRGDRRDHLVAITMARLKAPITQKRSRGVRIGAQARPRGEACMLRTASQRFVLIRCPCRTLQLVSAASGIKSSAWQVRRPTHDHPP